MGPGGCPRPAGRGWGPRPAPAVALLPGRRRGCRGAGRAPARGWARGDPVVAGSARSCPASSECRAWPVSGNESSANVTHDLSALTPAGHVGLHRFLISGLGISSTVPSGRTGQKRAAINSALRQNIRIDARVDCDLLPCRKVLEQLVGMRAHRGDRIGAELQAKRCLVRLEGPLDRSRGRAPRTLPSCVPSRHRRRP